MSELVPMWFNHVDNISSKSKNISSLINLWNCGTDVWTTFRGGIMRLIKKKYSRYIWEWSINKRGCLGEYDGQNTPTSS
jgi:hypothetical protein